MLGRGPLVDYIAPIISVGTEVDVERSVTGGIGEVGLDAILSIAPPLERALECTLSEVRPLTIEWRGKRIFDVVMALMLIILFIPLLVAIALAVGLGSRGPIVFAQERAGRGGRTFKMLKFRTMHADAETRLCTDAELKGLYLASDHKIPSATDPRITRVGRVLRWLSVDELPQLFNVLVGHMSLVGPRPVTELQLADYGAHLDTYFAIRPGLTGLWQVSGRNSVKFPERAYLDARYVRDCSLWLDLSILCRTPVVVVTGRGIE